jgi:hypothetical protein
MLTTQYAPSKQSGNGVAVAFSGSFKILAATDLAVYKIDASGNQGVLLILGTDYTVVFDPTQETWTVTFTVAPVLGGYALIERVSDNTQEAELPSEGPMPAKVVETMADKLQAQIQEIQASIAALVLQGAAVSIQTGSFAQLSALAALAPTTPFWGFVTDDETIRFYTGNIALGTNGWTGPIGGV